METIRECKASQDEEIRDVLKRINEKIRLQVVIFNLWQIKMTNILLVAM